MLRHGPFSLHENSRQCAGLSFFRLIGLDHFHDGISFRHPG